MQCAAMRRSVALFSGSACACARLPSLRSARRGLDTRGALPCHVIIGAPPALDRHETPVALLCCRCDLPLGSAIGTDAPAGAAQQNHDNDSESPPVATLRPEGASIAFLR